MYCHLKLRLFVELVSPTPGGAPVWITHTLRVCGFFSLLTNLPSSVALVKVFLFQFLLKFLAYCTENIFLLHLMRISLILYGHLGTYQGREGAFDNWRKLMRDLPCDT